MTVSMTYRRRAATALAVALTAAIALTGCAAGQDAQTANQFSVVDGASADVGQISIRNAGVAPPSGVAGYPAGAQAQLLLAIVNNATTSDVLTGVTSTGAASVLLSSGGSEPAGSVTSAPGTPTSSPASNSAAVSTPIPIPANTLVKIGGANQFVINLLSLKSALVSGQSVPVTFTFQTAGPVTVQLPVKLIKDGTAGETVDIEPSGAGE